MKAILTVVLSIAVLLTNAQKMFSLTELHQLNTLPEKAFAAALANQGFVSGGAEGAAGNFSTYTDKQKQHLTKMTIPQQKRGVIWQTTFPINVAKLKQELKQQGYAFLFSKTLDVMKMEVYRKAKETVTLSYSDDSEKGKLLSMYMVSVEEAGNEEP